VQLNCGTHGSKDIAVDILKKHPTEEKIPEGHLSPDGLQASGNELSDIKHKRPVLRWSFACQFTVLAL
jgi:hypothetical protein